MLILVSGSTPARGSRNAHNPSQGPTEITEARHLHAFRMCASLVRRAENGSSLPIGCDFRKAARRGRPSCKIYDLHTRIRIPFSHTGFQSQLREATSVLAGAKIGEINRLIAEHCDKFHGLIFKTSAEVCRWTRERSKLRSKQ